MRGSRTLLSLAVALSLGSIVLAPPRDATAEPVRPWCPSPPPIQHPSNPEFYDFQHTYRSCLSKHTNWDRTFPDQTVTATMETGTQVSVTTSTALAGAIASVRVGGKEYIASGGHGAALQYAFHAWQEGEAASECYNPTQAGSRLDDADAPAPYHWPSTSALYRMDRTGATIATASRMAMYIEREDSEKTGYGECHVTDYQSDVLPFSVGLSPYWLTTTVRMAPDHGLPGLDNVIELTAAVDSEDKLHANFNGVLVAYLQRDFTATYLHNPVTGELTEFTGNLASHEPPVRCTADGAHCLGIFRVSNGYYYTMTRGPEEYNGWGGEQTIQITAPDTNVGQGGKTRVNYHAYLAVGTKAQVAAALSALTHR